MDSKLVSDSLIRDDGDGSKTTHPLIAYTETFYELFPYYLSIGMTAEQYWDGDPWLVKYYRKAEQIRFDRKNQQLWLQGMYFYEALADVAPVMNAFAKRGTRIRPYSEQPYALNEKQKEKKQERDEKYEYEKMKAKMSAFMGKHNAIMTIKEGGGSDG